jgi:hypothetical protein
VAQAGSVVIPFCRDPFGRREEKRRLILNWLWRWHWAQESMLYRVIGVAAESNRASTLDPMEEDGLVRYHQDPDFGRLYMLTRRGIKEVPNPVSMARYPLTPGDKRMWKHDMAVQEIVLGDYRQYEYIPARLWAAWQRQDVARRKEEVQRLNNEVSGPGGEREEVLELMCSGEAVYSRLDCERLEKWSKLLTTAEVNAHRDRVAKRALLEKEKARIRKSESLSTFKGAIPDCVIFTDEADVALEYERSHQGMQYRMTRAHKHVLCLEAGVYDTVRYVCRNRDIAGNVWEAITKVGHMVDKFSVEVA